MLILLFLMAHPFEDQIQIPNLCYIQLDCNKSTAICWSFCSLCFSMCSHQLEKFPQLPKNSAHTVVSIQCLSLVFDVSVLMTVKTVVPQTSVPFEERQHR